MDLIKEVHSTTSRSNLEPTISPLPPKNPMTLDHLESEPNYPSTEKNMVKNTTEMKEQLQTKGNYRMNNQLSSNIEGQRQGI